MILAAGLGTRLKQFTKNSPKALVRINEKTLLEFVVENLKMQGVNEIIINVFHFADQIIDFVEANNKFDIRIEFSRESDLLDTGGGLKKASWFFDDDSPFILYNVDVLSSLDLNVMKSFHDKSNALATIAVRPRKTSRYFLFDSTGKMRGWENVKTGERIIASKTASELTPLSFMGIHIISPKIFEMFPEEEKFSIVDFYLRIAGEYVIKGFNGKPYTWIDCGKIESLLKAKNSIL